jgi:hypothetical protein
LDVGDADEDMPDIYAALITNADLDAAGYATDEGLVLSEETEDWA